MKKLVCLLLALVFVLQAAPVNVIAEMTNPVPTAQELTAAVLLTGLSDNAPGYRSGMEPSESMNAMQLAGWIREFQAQKQGYIMDIFENYDVELAYVKDNYPATFDMLRSVSEAGIGRFYSEYSTAKAWQDDMNYYRNNLNSLAGEIYVLADYFQKGGLTEKEQAVYAYEMRDKWQNLKWLVADVAARAELWNAEYDRLNALLTGPYEYSGSEESLAWLLEEVDNLRHADSRASVREATVSASAVRVQPDQTFMTRLSRLSPISSALADSGQTMHVKTIDDKYFYIGAIDGAEELEGVSVTVADHGKNNRKSLDTDETGYADFAVREFQSDKKGFVTVDVAAQKSGYRRVEAAKLKIKKGGKAVLPMDKDDGAPYPVSFSFWDHDILVQDYTVVNSSLNDTQQTFSVKISASGEYNFKIYAIDKDGKELSIGGGSGGSGDQVFSFKGFWLRELPGDCKVYLRIDRDGDSWTYTSRLVVKQAMIDDPIGDPDFGALMDFSLGFTLPNSWPKPLGGLEVSIELPIEKKYQFQLYVDLNGSGMLSFGTKAFEDKLQRINDGLWKSDDQEDLDDLIEDAEDEGYFNQVRAANGGNWSGRSKWTPMKLGKFSLEMAWFGYAQVQYREDDNNYGQWLGKGGGGFSATFKGEFGLMWPLASLSFYASATFSVWPEVAIAVDTYWPGHNGMPKFRHFDYAMASINFVLRIEIGVIATAGVKGVASLSIIGSVYIQFAFRINLGLDFATWLRNKATGKGGGLLDGDVDLTISVGGGVSVVLQILFAKVKKTLVDSGDKVIFTTKGAAPTTLVDRFIAFLVSPAAAEGTDNSGLMGIGGQVKTDNSSLVLDGKQLVSWNTDATKVEIFSMIPSSPLYNRPEQVMLYLQKDPSSGNHSVLFGTAIPKTNAISTTVLDCENDRDLPAELRDHFGPVDGYDVIDFDYCVVHAADLGLTGKTVSGSNVNLKDVLFTVCILAKDYVDQVKTLEDGTTQTVTVPKETWAYVRAFYLHASGLKLWLAPVILSSEYHTAAGGANDYLAACYPLCDEWPNNPVGNPRLYAALTKGEHGTVCMYRVFTSPLSVERLNAQNSICQQIFRGYYIGLTEDEKAAIDSWNCLVKGNLRNFDHYFDTKTYKDLSFLDAQLRELSTINPLVLSTRAAFFALSTDSMQDSELKQLAFKRWNQGSTQTLAENVVSMAPRTNIDLDGDGNHMAFFVQQAADGEGYRLMSCRSTGTANQLDPLIYWTLKDYDVDMPACEIQWTTLYDRECLYWMESAGQTEDKQGNLFRVKGIWYDETADALSEPFVIATVKTPTKDGYPVKMHLQDNNQGIYFVKRDNGTEQVYKFNFKLTMGLKLLGNALTDTLANPGTYDDMMLSVCNNGNVPLSGVDLVAYHYKDGQTPEAFETIHLDLVSPYKNTVTLRAGLSADVEMRYGENVANEERSSLTTDDQLYRYVVEKQMHGRRTVINESKTLMKPKLLMPGCFTAFNISLLLPQNWEGNHHIYVEVDRLYTTADSSFQKNVNQQNGMLMAFAAQPSAGMISVGKNGDVRREQGGGMLLMAAAAGNGAEETEEEDLSMFNTDVAFDRIKLDTTPKDLEITASRWETGGTEMVSLVVTNRAHISADGRAKNAVVIEAFLDDETEPVFRYSLPEEVSDKETWNFDLPLSLLTDGRSAAKVTIKVRGRNYDETGEHDNSAVILLDADTLRFLAQPESLEVPAGAEAVFRGAAIGGRTPYKYQWQVKTPRGAWQDMAGETGDSLTLRAVTRDMHGNQYRLKVTDASGYTAVSAAATLTVKDVPHTGDTAPLLWYALGILAAAGLIAYVIRRKKKDNE